MRPWQVVSTIPVIFVAIWWVTTESKGSDDWEEKVLSATTDPEFTIDSRTLDQAVFCPVSVPNAKETVLLVHGTGVTPQTNWDHTLLPPLVEAGFQPCYVAIPYRLLHDIQLSAEYLSYAIKKLAAAAAQKDHQISVISWSAGGLTTQWTLTFYPETRSRVKRHISLGPDYRGSWSMIPLVYFNMYSDAVVQQLPWSNLLAALARAGGGKAHVPTTSIGTSTDSFVQPSFYGEGGKFFKDSWRLSGEKARNIDLFKVCAARSLRHGRVFPRLFSHDSLLWEAASHKIIFDALNNEDTYLGSADNVTLEECRGMLAPGIPSASKKQHAEIMPELFHYASTLPLGAWPELQVRDYTSVE